MLVFYPLTEDYGVQDAGPHQLPGDTPRYTKFNRTGPYGMPRTAAFVDYSSTYYSVLDVAYSTNERLVAHVAETPFTIAFYFYAGENEGGIFAWDDDNGIQAYYSNTKLVLVGMFQKQILEFPNVVDKGNWNFFAITFNNETSILSLHGKHGKLYSTHNLNIYYAAAFTYRYTTGRRFQLGRSEFKTSSGSTTLNIRGQSAMSCFAAYRVLLSEEEILQLQDSCTVLHKTSPPGRPKLPLSPIPSKQGTVVKEGQMPWLVSVRSSRNQHKCTGLIFSENYVITSAQCGSAAANVVAGAYNLFSPGANEKLHSVKRVLSHPDGKDVAILELAVPLDWSSDYVNSIRLSTVNDINSTVTNVYTAGWNIIDPGDSIISPGLPRYSIVTPLPQSTCSKKWKELFETEYDESQYVCILPIALPSAACSADMGIPLIVATGDAILTSDKLTLSALLSRRAHTDCDSQPAFYTNLIPLSKWINEAIACNIPSQNFQPDECPMKL